MNEKENNERKKEEEQEEEYEICKTFCFTHILTSDFALIEQNLFAAHTKQV